MKETKVTNGWVPQGEYVEIAGRIVPGMVYICNSSQIGAGIDGDAKSTSCIDVSLPVSGSDKLGNSLTTRKYADMAPECRASYLDWLANGKKNRDCSPEYVMTYFCGLERRIVNDKPSEETNQLMEELKRLVTVFQFNRELKFLANRISSFLALSYFPLENNVKFPNEFATLPFDFHMEISDLIREGRALSGEQHFRWFSFDINSDSYKSFDLPDLKSDFLQKFKEVHPSGLTLAYPDRDFAVKFVSPTGDFESKNKIILNGQPLLDLRNFEATMDEAKRILDEVIRNRPKQNVPEQIQTNAQNFTAWAESLAGKNIPVKLEELLNNLGTVPRTNSNALDWLVITNSLTEMGFGIAPHVLLMPKELNHNDQVFLYRSNKNHFQRRDRGAFLQALVYLGLGACFFSQQNHSSKEVSAALRTVASSWKNLDESDMAGIHANIDYLLVNPPEIRFINKVKNFFPEDGKGSIRTQTVKFAKALNAGKAKKLATMEAFYDYLNLDPKLAETDFQTR